MCGPGHLDGASSGHGGAEEQQAVPQRKPRGRVKCDEFMEKYYACVRFHWKFQGKFMAMNSWETLPEDPVSQVCTSLDFTGNSIDFPGKFMGFQ